MAFLAKLLYLNSITSEIRRTLIFLSNICTFIFAGPYDTTRWSIACWPIIGDKKKVWASNDDSLHEPFLVPTYSAHYISPIRICMASEPWFRRPKTHFDISLANSIDCCSLQTCEIYRFATNRQLVTFVVHKLDTLLKSRKFVPRSCFRLNSCFTLIRFFTCLSDLSFSLSTIFIYRKLWPAFWDYVFSIFQS